MGYIVWTETLVDNDNQTAQNIINMKNDVAAVIDNNVSNINISSKTADRIVESKFTFDTIIGHDHDGSNSKSFISNATHYRKGLTLTGDDDNNIVVNAGTIEIGGTVLTATTTSGDIAVATAGNWLNGASSTSQWIYVYVYDNSDVLDYKLSDEAPNLSDTSSNTVELPFRYRAYGSVFYRCVGSVFQDADGDLCFGHSGSEGLYLSNFDASSVCIINGVGTGSDQTFNTIWTPKLVEILYGDQDTTPAAGESFYSLNATQKSLDTNWYTPALNALNNINTHNWIALTTAGVVNAITAQSAGTAGSFTIDAMGDGKYFYAKAYSDLL